MPVDFKPKKSTIQFKPKQAPIEDLNIIERGILKIAPWMEPRIRKGKEPATQEDIITPGYGNSMLPEIKIDNALGQTGYDFARSMASPEGVLAGPKKLKPPFTEGMYYKKNPFNPKPNVEKLKSTLAKVKESPQIDAQSVSTVTPKINEPVGVSEYLNIPRAFAAAGDISAPFRQGLAAIGRKEWWTSWKPMIQSLASDEAYQASQAAIKANPKFTEAVESGLSLGEITTKFEEQFASRIANKIPGIKHSNRAYTAYLNNLRMDLFANLSDKATKLGVQYDPKILAAHINTLTGRGSMGLRTGSSSAQLEKAAEALNTMFFSPRLIASRVQMLNPASYTKMDAFTRKEALRDLATLVSVTGMTSGVAAQMGLDVETDPTSADFAKIKSGNTRVDHMGGFQQYVRLGAQIFDRSLDDREAEKFVRYKLSPTANLIGSLFTGEDALGRPAKPEESVLKAFVPMLLQDAWELYHEDPEIARTLGFTALASTGVGVQSYGATEEKRGAVPNISLPSR